MPIPAFIIGGAPRSGTTWLLHLLERHPDVFLARPFVPEPKFFLIDNEYEKGIAYYKQTWFKGVTPSQVAGEKSTNYLENPIVAQRIFEHFPDTKFIFILREPADRAYNNYLWTKGNGLEDLSFEEALQMEKSRLSDLPEKWSYSRPFDYFSRGLYAKHLDPYVKLFSKRQILCLKYEDIATSPDRITVAVHRFLNISERPEDSQGLGIINSAQNEAHIEETLSEEQVHLIRERYKQSNMALANMFPDFEIW